MLLLDCQNNFRFFVFKHFNQIETFIFNLMSCTCESTGNWEFKRRYFIWNGNWTQFWFIDCDESFIIMLFILSHCEQEFLTYGILRNNTNLELLMVLHCAKFTIVSNCNIRVEFYVKWDLPKMVLCYVITQPTCCSEHFLQH